MNRSKHVAVLEEMVQPGKWFMFPQSFVRACGGCYGTAILLGYLLGKQGAFGPWFFCPATKIEEELCMSDSKRLRYQNKLIGLGVLSVKKEKGRIPTRNLYRLDSERILELTLPRACTSKGSVGGTGAGSIEAAPVQGLIETLQEKRDTVGSLSDTAIAGQPERPSEPCGDLQLQKEGQPMFFDNLAPPVADDAHLALATRLRDAVRQRWQGSAKAPSMAKWAAVFAKLERQQEFTKVLAVFEWYLRNMGGDFVPVAKSATSFHSKWDALLAAYERDPKNTPVSELAHKVCGRLDENGFAWPKGARSGLPAAVDQWLQWAEDMVTDARAWQADALPSLWAAYGYSSKEPDRPACFKVFANLSYAKRAVAEIEHGLKNREHFVQQLFAKYHRQVSMWEDWNGRFPKPSIEDLKRLNGYARRQQAFDSLIDLLTIDEMDMPTPPTPAQLKQYNATKVPLKA